MPLKVRVPEPALVNIPVPLITPLRVAALLLVFNVPLAERMTARPLLKPPQKSWVPPLKVMLLAALPRLLSADTWRLPA